MSPFKKINLPAVLCFIGLVCFFEGAVRLNWLPEFLFPAPSTILQTLISERRDFLAGFLETLQGSLAGLFLSIVVGGALAILFSLSPFLRKAILPFAIFFQTVPIIAVAPLLVIYFGFGKPTVIAAAFIVSLFPVIASTLLGLESIAPGQRELFQLYGASSWQTLLKLRLPAAYASIYGGLKVSVGLAIIGAIAGEFVAGGGLGAMIDSARTQQRLDLVYGALLLLSVMGLLLMSCLKLLHLYIQKFRPYGMNLKD